MLAVFAQPRTGSSLLLGLLAKHPQFVQHGELFRAHGALPLLAQQLRRVGNETVSESRLRQARLRSAAYQHGVETARAAPGRLLDALACPVNAGTVQAFKVFGYDDGGRYTPPLLPAPKSSSPHTDARALVCFLR